MLGPWASAAGPLPRLGPAPNFALTTQQNDRLWLTQLRPRVVVLTFGCAACAACPTVLPTLADLARRVGDAAGRGVFFVLVSLDPAHDTPGVLREFARSRGLGPPAWLLLTGAAAEVDVGTRRYGFDIRLPDGRVRHRCLGTLLDGAGTIRAAYDDTDLSRLPADLADLLAEQAGSGR